MLRAPLRTRPEVFPTTFQLRLWSPPCVTSRPPESGSLSSSSRGKGQTPWRRRDAPHRGNKWHGKSVGLVGPCPAFKVSGNFTVRFTDIKDNTIHTSKMRPPAAAVQAEKHTTTSYTIDQVDAFISQALFQILNLPNSQNSGL